MDENPTLSFAVEEVYLDAIRRLPWEVPLEEWGAHGVKLLTRRRGEGRHVVVFVKSGPHRLVVKEVPLEIAQREVAIYRQLLALGIRTLTPLGWVAREGEPIPVETPIGIQWQRDETGYTVTLLEHRVIPNSHLYPMPFAPESRQRIMAAVADLFVDLHSNGVYWGDASPNNLLLQFVEVRIPQLGRRSRLRALLADAETVELYPSLSRGLREDDLERFFESVRWFNEDLRLKGVPEPRLAGPAERDALLEAYERRLAVAQEAKGFAAATGLEPGKVLGDVEHHHYLNTLRKHIEEHRWYLGEQLGRAVELPEAADDWYRNAFLPVCDLLRHEDAVAYFPGKTAAELYVEIMTHKYYASRARGRDVGMIFAIHDYIDRFGTDQPKVDFWQRMSTRLREIFGWREAEEGA